jgi:hypothetical protein
MLLTVIANALMGFFLVIDPVFTGLWIFITDLPHAMRYSLRLQGQL